MDLRRADSPSAHRKRDQSASARKQHSIAPAFTRREPRGLVLSAGEARFASAGSDERALCADAHRGYSALYIPSEISPRREPAWHRGVRKYGRSAALLLRTPV